MSGLFTELKRRDVFRVAVVYLIAGWIILQVADIMMDALNLPDWTLRLVVTLRNNANCTWPVSLVVRLSLLCPLMAESGLSKIGFCSNRTSALPLRFQPVDATHWLNRSAGVLKSNVFLGRSLSCRATAFNLF